MQTDIIDASLTLFHTDTWKGGTAKKKITERMFRPKKQRSERKKDSSIPPFSLSSNRIFITPPSALKSTQL